MRFNLLLLSAVLPGAAAALVSGYWVLVDWRALAQAHDRLEQVALSSERTLEDIALAQAAENRHRLNCFAEGIGVLLGGIWMSIGIHGICTLPLRTQGRNP
ncbi:MAG: hypothetical protein HC857_04025 [Synechococcales cyanobacterium RU_4_20]|nr:hypothetical protein [Synechococcales cyanobacterium RU_4_20]NJR70600.1 hypothetical protein [Synechococcales cyanobacterium CRU_2_2]